MADTQRTRAQILALFADNVTGQISAQDLRDFTVTVMESEFVNAGDAFARPAVAYTTTDKSARGWKIYSQYIGSDCSFMNVLYQDNSTGYWKRACASGSVQNGFVALAMDSYTSDTSTATLLLEGMVYNSIFSTTFSRLIGRPVFLASEGANVGSITTTRPTLSYTLGYIMASDNFGGSAIGKWYFKPQWQVVGA
jgi:hypothetical protein